MSGFTSRLLLRLQDAEGLYKVTTLLVALVDQWRVHSELESTWLQWLTYDESTFFTAILLILLNLTA